MVAAGNNNNQPTRFPPLEPKSPSGVDLLAAERRKSSFNVDSMTKLIYPDGWLDRMNKVLAVIEKDPAFDKTMRYYQNRYEGMRQAYAKEKRIRQLVAEHGWDDMDRSMATFLYDGVSPFSVHHSMFMTTLRNQCNDEQRKLFYEPATRLEIIGCYAQTELGHGSNVRGLETTATYIPEDNEFEIHSPHLTSSKWWIGGLGKSATHCVLMARLIIRGKDYGPHPFCFQIRSLRDHRPLPGITVGDIGPKLGYNSNDNGFILFDHFRVPHISLLAKFSQVKPGTGEYIKPPNARLSYGTMVFIRANIVAGSRFAMARAATVAVRYSAVRRQFVDAAEPKKWGKEVIETPVIDYTMQQYRLFPVIAGAYALLFTGREMLRLYDLNQEAMKQGDYGLLADLHASSSGLKSLTTTMAVNAVEECRRACGGHGYSMFSGLGQFYQDYVPNVTFEGDNYILTHQTTRYICKTYRNVVAGKAVPSEHNMTVTYLMQYLQDPKATSADDLTNPEVILNAFGYRAAYFAAQLVEQLDHEGRSWNSMLVEVNRVSRAHCQYMLVRNFFVGIRQADPQLQPVLSVLARLFALHMMEQDLADFMLTGYISSAQGKSLRKLVLDYISKIRDDAVALVDAFALPDYYLHSALGRYDGKVYESMTKMAELEPLNQTQVVDMYEEYIKPHVYKPNSKL